MNCIIEKSNNSITFKVCDTIKNEINYKEFTIDSIMEHQQQDNEIDEYGEIIGDKIEKVKEKKIINSSLNENSKFIGSNSFIHSAILAFSEHHHLLIRPDDIWMCILTQLSNYLNKFAEEIRDKIIDFKGKKLLVVETDYPILEAPFDKLTLEMSKQIEKNIKDPSIRDWMIPNFSTTTNTDRVVYSAALMSSVKSYFEFKYFTRCGLPSVTLNGTVEDWVEIKNRIEILKEFDVNNKLLMSEWVWMLHPVIDKFIETANGNPDIEWWKLIADSKNVSGGPLISGWITVFCPFNKRSICIFDNDTYWSRGRQIRAENPNTWLRIGIDTILNGYISVPIILEEPGNSYTSTLYAGHLAINLNQSQKSTISPSLDWCLSIDK